VILGDPPAGPFYKERFQQASRPHICHDCGEEIPAGMKYRVAVWKKKWFDWKKNHEVCACQTLSSSSESSEEEAVSPEECKFFATAAEELRHCL